MTFVISWAHRLTGVMLVIFIGFHIYTLSSLTTPGAYADKMKLYRLPLLAFIEWTLALPVMFHALTHLAAKSRLIGTSGQATVLASKQTVHIKSRQYLARLLEAI